VETLELLDRRRHHPFAGPRLAVAVIPHPGLVAAEAVATPVGDVAHPIVGEFRDERMAEGTGPLDLLTEDGEQLGRYRDDRHVADRECLDRRPPCLAPMGRDLGPLGAEDECRGRSLSRCPHTLRAVRRHRLLLG
jgi:hypothetical protein